MKTLRRRACLAVAWAAVALPAWAGQWQVTARAQPARVASQTGSAEIIAEVRNEAGQPAPDGTEIFFASTLGTIVPSAQTQGGLARSRLTSATPGTAEVTVVAGASSARVLVEFSGEGGSGRSESRMVRLSGRYVAYSLERQVVVAADRARLEQGRLFIEAESLQYDVSLSSVRAQRNVRVGNGAKVIEGERLSYDLSSKRGMLMRTRPDVTRASFDGSTLSETEVRLSSGGDALKPVEADAGRSWVVARQVIVYPGEKIQFIKAQLYLEGQRLVVLPCHQIPLNSYQSKQGLVSQVFSFTSGGGLNVDFPVYYLTTGKRSGSLHIRRSSYSGLYGQGWSLGLQEEYDLGRMRGTVSLDNPLSSTMGVRWEHHQNVGETTADISFSRYRYDSSYPPISYGNAFIRRSVGKADLTVTASGSRYGMGTDWSTSSAIRWPQVPLGNRGWHYDVGADMRVGTGLGLAWPGVYDRSGVQTSLGLDIGLASPMCRLGSKSTFSTNLLARGGMGAGGSRENLEARLSFRRSLGPASSAMITYTHMLGSQDYWSLGRRRIDGNVFVNNSNRWSLSGFFSHDLTTSGLFASLGGRYNLPFERYSNGTARWRLEADMGHSRYGGFKVTDSRIALSRDVGRSVVSLVFSPSGATGYGPYGGGFGFNRGKRVWIEVSLGQFSF